MNVIAPIMTNSEWIVPANYFLSVCVGHPVWAWRRVERPCRVLKLQSKESEGTRSRQHLDVAGARNSSDGSISLFILNRDLAKSHEVEIVWEDQAPTKVLNASVLTGDDLKAVNSFQSPQKVAPQAFTKPALSGSHTKFEVPARSYTVIQFGA